MFKDGSGPISFTIEGTAEPGTPGEDAVQLIVKYLGDVGIKCAYKYFERALYTEHYSANEIEAAFWGGDRTVLPLVPAAHHLPRHAARPPVGGRLWHLV